MEMFGLKTYEVQRRVMSAGILLCLLNLIKSPTLISELIISLSPFNVTSLKLSQNRSKMAKKPEKGQHQVISNP
jgi:hypothetical protein